MKFTNKSEQLISFFKKSNHINYTNNTLKTEHILSFFFVIGVIKQCRNQTQIILKVKSELFFGL